MKEGVNGEGLAQASEAISFERTLGRMSVPQFDAEEFREFIDKLDATEEEKMEYLQLLWKIAITFVDISFGIDSTQRIIPSTREKDSPQESHLVQIKSYQKQFQRAATDEAARKDQP